MRSLKILFKTEVLGRQLVSLRLEKNSAASKGEWQLPRLIFPAVKAVRGEL